MESSTSTSTRTKCESDIMESAKVQEALDQLKQVIQEDLESVAKTILPSTASAENATNEITAAIDATKNGIWGLTSLEHRYLGNAVRDTCEVIHEVTWDLRNGSNLKKISAVLRIMGAASGIALLAGPAGVLPGVIVGALCRLAGMLLCQMEEDQNPEESPEASLRRVIEEVNKTQTFQEQLAAYKGKLLGMSNRLGDLHRYCKNQGTMTGIHYSMIARADYIDDGEEFLETLMHFIQKEIKTPEDAQNTATLVYAYTTTALVRTQQLNKLMILCKNVGDNLLLESVCQRLKDRYSNDKERFAWLQNPPNSSNHLLYAQVMALPHSKRCMVEAYVGKIPGHLCLLKSRHHSEFFEMKPTKRLSGYMGNSLLNTSDHNDALESDSPRSESMFIFYHHKEMGASITNQESDEATCTIFSIGNAGYICPDANFKYITATACNPKDQQCLWKCKGFCPTDKMCELMPFAKPHYRFAKRSADYLGGLFGSSPLHLVKRKPKRNSRHLMRDDAFFPSTKPSRQETRILAASVNDAVRQRYPVVIID